MAEKSRERTAYEMIVDRIQECFDTPISGREIVNPGADMFDDEQVGDKWFLRNVISAKEAFLALRSDPELSTYKNADVRTFGRAITSVIRTSPLPCHRQSQKFCTLRRCGQVQPLFPAQVGDEPTTMGISIRWRACSPHTRG